MRTLGDEGKPVSPVEKVRTALLDAALRLLGMRPFELPIHDASFPSTPEEDVGRGIACNLGGQAFLRFARCGSMPCS